VILLYGQVLGQFLISLVVQVLLWRALRRPGDVVPHQILLLFALFLGGPLIHFLFTHSLNQMVLALGLGTAYVMSFPAASAQSPTILMIDFLSRAPGLSAGELEKQLNQRVNLVGDRLLDLEADGLGRASAEGFKPSRAGYFLGLVFWTYRRILGLPLGGG
jgi:hypothetical protein